MPRAEKGTDAVQFELLPAIRLGDKGKPIVVPTVVDGAVRCVAINAYAGWLNQLVESKVKSRDVVSVFCERARQGLVSSAGADEDTANDAEAENETPKKGRQALGLDDDSDEELLAAATPACGGSRRKTATGKTQEFTTIVVDGLSITLKRRFRGRGLLMPLGGEMLVDLIKHLQNQAICDERRELPRKSLKRQPSEAALCNDEDHGRVKWLFGSHQWQIRYVDEMGKVHSCTKGLMVPRADFDGNILSDSSFRTIRAQMLMQARRRWNALDKRQGPRYESVGEKDDAIGES
jgi:hypothetical protein